MSLRGNCPICGKGPINPTFKEFVITVALSDQPEHPISGLGATNAPRNYTFSSLWPKMLKAAARDPTNLTARSLASYCTIVACARCNQNGTPEA